MIPFVLVLIALGTAPTSAAEPAAAEEDDWVVETDPKEDPEVREEQLEQAAERNDLAALNELLDHGARSERGLRASATRGHLEAVKLLLSRGSPPNAADEHGFTPLMRAAADGRTEVVRLLLEKGADPNLRSSAGYTASMLAGRAGHMAAISALKAAGAQEFPNPDDQHKKRKPPPPTNATPKQLARALRHAAEDSDEAQVEALLKRGADPNSSDKVGYTPLMWAALKNRAVIMRALIAKGADVNAVYRFKGPPDQGTALMLAANQGHAEAITILLTAKADPNLRGWKGNSALLYAAREGHKKVVELLLAAGANPALPGEDKTTPRDQALKNGHQAIAGLITAALLRIQGEQGRGRR